MSAIRVVPSARLIGAALAMALAAAGGLAVAQVSPVLDEHGNLTEMPFEPDVPITRTEVRLDGEARAFFNYTPLPYDQVVEHYLDIYLQERELAPGWILFGTSYDYGADVYLFLLTYAHQRYRLEITPDEQTGGSVIVLRGEAAHLPFHRYLYSLMPFRAVEVGPIPVPPD